jgi:protease IV
MSKAGKWVLGITIGVVLASFLLLFFVSVFSLWGPADESVSTRGEKIAQIDLTDVIYTSTDIVRQFKKFRENTSIKAIVFRVESPGGGVSASQEIYEEVKKTRDSGKPVVVSMGTIAASGGYYVSCGASRIVANPGTLTGSIGVIFQFYHVNELLDKIGIDATTYKTGRYKDAGSPFRNPTEADKAYFDELLADVYEQFVGVVSTERGLKRGAVVKLADGRVFTGRQALQYGLIDTLGTLQDAIHIAAQLGGITGEPRVVKEERRFSLLDRILGGALTDVKDLKTELFRQPVVQYRFLPPY